MYPRHLLHEECTAFWNKNLHLPTIWIEYTKSIIHIVFKIKQLSCWVLIRNRSFQLTFRCNVNHYFSEQARNLQDSNGYQRGTGSRYSKRTLIAPVHAFYTLIIFKSFHSLLCFQRNITRWVDAPLNPFIRLTKAMLGGGSLSYTIFNFY